MNQQCIAWKDQELIALESRHWRNVYYTRNRNGDSLDGGALGEMLMAIISAPHELIENIRRFIEDTPFDQSVRFYREAGRQGLLGRGFSFQALAVFERDEKWHGVALNVTSQAVEVRQSNGSHILAVGKDAIGAMSMMARGVSAQHAVHAQAVMSDRYQLEPLNGYGVYYDPTDVHTPHKARTASFNLGALEFAVTGTLENALKDSRCVPACATTGQVARSGLGSATTGHTC